MHLKILLLLTLLLSSIAKAFEFDDVSIVIPEGFEGPKTHDLGQGVITTGFIYPHQDNRGTLLQMSVWDPGQKFPIMSVEQLKTTTEKYLLQFLQGTQGARDDFRRQEVEFIQISGQPIAKVAWTGKALGASLQGVMYTLIYNSKVYSFNTQDLSELKGKYMQLAISAIEAIELEL